MDPILQPSPSLMTHARCARRALCLLPTLALMHGCATLGQIAAVEDVEFSIEGISQVRLAGVDLSDLDAFSDLTLAGAATIGAAGRRRDLTFTIELQVEARNPPTNSDARIVRMEWMLFLEDRETVTGIIAEEIVVPSGQTTVFPVVARLNLFEFFDGSARDLFELALSFTGMGGESKEVSLRALPVIETVFGPLTYENPIRIMRARVGR